MWENISTQIPTHQYERIGVSVKITLLKLGLVQKQKKVPV